MAREPARCEIEDRLKICAGNSRSLGQRLGIKAFNLVTSEDFRLLRADSSEAAQR
jgi:hypothetical protein